MTWNAKGGKYNQKTQKQPHESVASEGDINPRNFGVSDGWADGLPGATQD